MYINDRFLLNNEVAVKLYNDFAKDMPILDYHCHLSPKEIAEDKKYKNITEIWLGGDHYKWRAMRINGVEEKYITGDASDYEKFLAWAKTMEYCIGNPLYQWSHLELSRFFGIDDILNEKSAKDIWERANKKLETMSARQLIEDSNVTHLCTTDDPIDDLRYHKELLEDKTFKTKVYPAFRPDNAIKIEKDTFIDWLNKLEDVVDFEIKNIDDFIRAMYLRIDFFNEMGCKLSDHAFDTFDYVIPNKENVNKTLIKKINIEKLTESEIIEYKIYLISELAKKYNDLNWTMQIHLGAQRDNNTKMYKKLGPDTGFDSIGDSSFAKDLSEFLDSLDSEDKLPRTILYNLNSKDNDVLATMMGNFPKENVPARVVFGTAWWFYDQKLGIESQLKSMANLGILRRFVGMVTDSRSFLSYTRHEYFRRVLCNLLGEWVESGEIPEDYDLLGSMIREISYENALEYFSFK